MTTQMAWNTNEKLESEEFQGTVLGCCKAPSQPTQERDGGPETTRKDQREGET